MGFTLADFQSAQPGGAANSVIPSPRYIHGIVCSNVDGGDAILYIGCVTTPDPSEYARQTIANALRAEKRVGGAQSALYAAVLEKLRAGAEIDGRLYRELPAGTRLGDAAALVANWIVTARGGRHPIANPPEDETEAGQVLKISRAIAFGKALRSRAEKRRGR